MPTAREDRGRLILELGSSGTITIPPLPGRHGKEALGLLIGITLGSTKKQHGIERVFQDTEKLTFMCLGVNGIAGRLRRRKFERLRATEQEFVGQAAILWNVQGGRIDAVLDLLDEAGGYPKALGRVMRSCGLGKPFETLTTLLNGVVQEPSSAEASTPSTTTPTGTSSTSASSQKNPQTSQA